MAILQSKLDELRYMKRGNLQQEAKLIGNMYRDLIRSYGIDVSYRKLDTSKFLEFKNIIDENTILRYAYGYDHDPDYSISATMLAYMEVENDIFQLNKFGLNPNMDVNFYFDSTDFACALATKLGKYKEYKVKEKNVCFEVPEFNSSTSSEVFPYHIGGGYTEVIECGLLSGRVDGQIDGYEFDKEYTIPCVLAEHTDFKVEFPVNKFIHKSFKYRIVSDDYIDQALFLTFSVSKIPVDRNRSKCILTGKLHGAILFYDLQKIDKYQTMIHPEVGDVVTIDFPDQSSREQYEITEAIDKQMTQDGINPLMHKYIWKCKARRYVNSYEDMEQNEGNDIADERLKFENAVQQQVADAISMYPDKEDKVYGGYEAQQMKYDKNEIGSKTDKRHHQLEILDPNLAIDLLQFECGSKLCTTGYDLVFVNKAGEAVKVASGIDDSQRVVGFFELSSLFEQDLEHIKANDSTVVFTDLNGSAHVIAYDNPAIDVAEGMIQATANELELCLNSLADKTFLDYKVNNDLDNFYKFSNTRTFLFATAEDLFCKLASTGKMFKLT